MNQRYARGAMTIAVALLAGCTKPNPDYRACTPGETRTCTCANGFRGTQQCAGEEWGACYGCGAVLDASSNQSDAHQWLGDGGSHADSTSRLDGQPAGVGGPCPCPARSGLVCVLGACRAKCDPPTGACEEISSCPADQRCVGDRMGRMYVCVPGVGLGEPCDETTFCAGRTTCFSLDGESARCMPVCSRAYEECGTDGICLRLGEGCLACSEL